MLDSTDATKLALKAEMKISGYFSLPLVVVGDTCRSELIQNVVRSM